MFKEESIPPTAACPMPKKKRKYSDTLTEEEGQELFDLFDDSSVPVMYFVPHPYVDPTGVSEGGDHTIGAYSPRSRRRRIESFLEKRDQRVWTKRTRYDVRKNFANSRMRVHGRFITKEDEAMLTIQLGLV